MKKAALLGVIVALVVGVLVAWQGPVTLLLDGVSFFLRRNYGISFEWSEANYSGERIAFKDLQLTLPGRERISFEDLNAEFSLSRSFMQQPIRVNAAKLRIEITEDRGTSPVRASRTPQEQLAQISESLSSFKNLSFQAGTGEIVHSSWGTLHVSPLSFSKIEDVLSAEASFTLPETGIVKGGSGVLRCHGDSLRAECGLAAAKLTTLTAAEITTLPPLEFRGEGSFVLDSSGYQAKFAFREEKKNLVIEGEAVDSTPRLKVTLSGNPAGTLLSQLFKEFEIAVSKGSFELEVEFPEGIAGTAYLIKVKASGITGVVQETAVGELEIQGVISAARAEEGVSLASKNISLRAKELDTGIVLENLRVAGSIGWTSRDRKLRLGIHEVSFGSLGAIVHSRDWKIALPLTECAESNWRVTDLNLAKLEELYGTRDLDAEGLISGSIPLQLCEDGIVVEGGKLSAVPPQGHLKYVFDESVTKGSSALEFTARALKNFRFDRMEVAVTYQKTGVLILGVELGGRSLELNSNTPINVNLTIEESIPQLLRSLRISEGVAEGVRSGKLR